MKKFFNKVAFAVLTLPTALLAQEGSTSSFDLSEAGTAAKDLGTSVKDLLTGDVLDACKYVAAGIVVIWAFWKVLRWCGVGRK